MFTNTMVNEFYIFMANTYNEYHKNPINKIKKQAHTHIKTHIQAHKHTNNDITIIEPVVAVVEPVVAVVEPVVVDEPVVVERTEIKLQTFVEYFLYKLYYNYGVERRMITENIALLFYNKDAKGYKPNENITMLCRHMILDCKIMRIISIGIPKAINFNEFTKIYNININDASSNGASDSASNASNASVETYDKTAKYQISKFPEGTMITYNPSLKKLNISIQPEDNKDNKDDLETIHNEEGAQEILNNIVEIKKNINIQFNQMLQYSTRKVVGTGSFGSSKTFLEMFNENNTIANTNLHNIPDEMMQDIVLVFNIEHPDNHIIASNSRNYNTLCGVFKFKTELQSTIEYELIKNIDTTNLEQDFEKVFELIKDSFIQLGTNMITHIPVRDFKQSLVNANLDINLHIVEEINKFENKTIVSTNNTLSPLCANITETIKIIEIVELSLQELIDIVNNKPKTFQGYIIYGTNGERTKIMNSKYKELKLLKGNKPIVLEQHNTKNLYYLYWRLMKLQLIPKFINEFDETGKLGYRHLFFWFANITREYSINLFIVYHNSFVKRTFAKYNIPYSMKPLCGDLHNLYKQNKIPISQLMVEQYIFTHTAGKLFWRLFSGK